MDCNNLNSKAISLNVWGICVFKKRKSIIILNWLINQSADIFFLQETYNTAKVANQWRKQWTSEFSFLHGSNHSCGVAILVQKSLDFKPILSCVDNDGRYLIVKAIIQDIHFLLINTCVPNKTSNQSSFFQALSELIFVEELWECNHKFVIGGDFNVTLQPSLDCSGGNTTLKESVKFLEGLLTIIIIQYDLVDIWRVCNPKSKEFTWHQRKPIIQKRLDYWFISELLQDDVTKFDIITSIKTDHSAMVLDVDSMADQLSGPSSWKFNNSLLDHSIFVQSMRDNITMARGSKFLWRLENKMGLYKV